MENVINIQQQFLNEDEIQLWIHKNIGLVIRIAEKIFHKVKPKEFQKSDFISECVIWAYSILKKFDVSKGFTINTYLTNSIFFNTLQHNIKITGRDKKISYSPVKKDVKSEFIENNYLEEIYNLFDEKEIIVFECMCNEVSNSIISLKINETEDVVVDMKRYIKKVIKQHIIR